MATRPHAWSSFRLKFRSGDRAFWGGGAGPHRPAEPDLSLFELRRDPQNRMGAMPCRSTGPPEHVSEVVIDRVQVLRGGVDRSHLDPETIADHAVAERLLGHIRSIPREMHRRGIGCADAGH